MRSVRILATALLIAAAFAAGGMPRPASAQGGRVALVIANAAYPDGEAELPSPVNDAVALSEELTRRGFTVEVAKNLTKEDMQAALDRFMRRIEPGSVALVFYSGYAIQVARKNYLIPIKVRIWKEPDVVAEGVSTDKILADAAKRGAATRVMILDASRRNPFERRYRSFSTGLAPAAATPGTLSLSAAAPGSVVNETTATRSLFVAELIKQIGLPGISAEQAFGATRDALARATRNQQVPAMVSGLEEAFSFDAGYVKPPSPVVPEDRAALDFQDAKAIGTKAAYERFLAKYPTGSFAEQARAEIARLELAPGPKKETSPPIVPDDTAELDFQDAKAIGTKAAYERFLARYPTGPLAAQARAEIARLEPAPGPKKDPGPPIVPEDTAELDFQNAKAIGTKAAYESFLAKHPSGSLAAQARAEIARLEPAPGPKKEPEPQVPTEDTAVLDFQDAKAIGTKAAYESFLAKHPSGSLAAQARAEIARLDAVVPEKPHEVVVKPLSPAERQRKAALDQRIAKNPRDEQAYYERGQFYAQRSDTAAAIADFDQSIRMRPDNPEAFNNRCWMRAVAQDLEMARSDCDQALKLRPAYVDALDSRGFVNLKSSRFQAAVADYDAALKIDPDHSSALYGRGIARRRLGQTGPAEKDIASALRLNASIGDEFAGYGLR